MCIDLQQFVLGSSLACSLLLAGCATPSVITAQQTSAVQTQTSSISNYSGRFLVRIEQQAAQSVNFQLTGNANKGTLQLFGPFASSVATIHWNPTLATLQQGEQIRNFASLDELLTQILGTELSSAALLGWFEGKETPAEGWETDLSQYQQGKITAQRAFPPPAVKLQIILQ